MEEPIRVLLGSGLERRANWIHVDIDPSSGADLVWPAEYLPMLGDASVDVIDAGNLLPLYTLEGAFAALREWHRVLKAGGELRLEVPDLTLSLQCAGRAFNARGVDIGLSSLFGTSPDPASGGAALPHRWGWTAESLSAALAEIGFTAVNITRGVRTESPTCVRDLAMRVTATKGHPRAAASSCISGHVALPRAGNAAPLSASALLLGSTPLSPLLGTVLGAGSKAPPTRETP
ncbi:MAG: hypothetical protein AB1486_01205 [Planctomycetota bacterium]